MPVSGHNKNKCNTFPEMTIVHGYFPVGQPFWFSFPRTDRKDILIKAVAYNRADLSRCSYNCCLWKWCASDGSWDRGVKWIPACSGLARNDNKHVYFVEV